MDWREAAEHIDSLFRRDVEPKYTLPLVIVDYKYWEPVYEALRDLEATSQSSASQGLPGAKKKRAHW